MTAELNVRLGVYTKEGMIRKGSKVKERLQASLEEQEKQQIRSATMHYLKFGDVQSYPKSNVYVGKIK